MQWTRTSLANRTVRSKDLRLSSEGSQIRQKGTLKKGIGISFEMAGIVSATPDGKTRIHPAQMKMERLPVKGLLKLFFGLRRIRSSFSPMLTTTSSWWRAAPKRHLPGPEGLYAGLQ